MEKDLSTQGNVVIDTEHFGTVDVSPSNFKKTAEEMTNDEKWQKAIKTTTGVYCKMPDKLQNPDIPF